MAVQQVTIRLPETLYHQVKARARRTQRTIEDEVAAVVAAALPELGDLPHPSSDEMEQMALMTDHELWQAARATMTVTESRRMQAFLLKRQGEGLSLDQEAEAEQLVRRQERLVLIRARAAALLKQRGHDVADLMKLQ